MVTISGHIMEEVKSEAEVQAQYIARNPVSRVIQCAAVQSENEVNTIRADFISQGMNHSEGGWPKVSTTFNCNNKRARMSFSCENFVI